MKRGDIDIYHRSKCKYDCIKMERGKSTGNLLCLNGSNAETSWLQRKTQWF